MNESSFMGQELRRAGYAIVTHQEVVEAEALPPAMSAQKTELIALPRFLYLGKGKKVTM